MIHHHCISICISEVALQRSTGLPAWSGKISISDGLPEASSSDSSMSYIVLGVLTVHLLLLWHLTPLCFSGLAVCWPFLWSSAGVGMDYMWGEFCLSSLYLFSWYVSEMLCMSPCSMLWHQVACCKGVCVHSSGVSQKRLNT